MTGMSATLMMVSMFGRCFVMVLPFNGGTILTTKLFECCNIL